MAIRFNSQYEVNPTLNRFLSFYIDSGLKVSDTHHKFRKKAEEFMMQNADVEKLLDCYREYTPDDFVFVPGISERSKYDFVIGFENLFIALYRELKQMPQQMDFKGFQSQDNPPLEVYNFIGHNKLDVKHDEINYSSLFK